MERKELEARLECLYGMHAKYCGRKGKRMTRRGSWDGPLCLSLIFFPLHLFGAFHLSLMSFPFSLLGLFHFSPFLL